MWRASRSAVKINSNAAAVAAILVREMSKRSSPETTELKSSLSAKIKNSSALIGIIGMGYVGLPLMLACTAKNLRVLGFDIDTKKVKDLNSGQSPLRHVADTAIGAMREAQLFEATDDLKRLSEVDVVVICVPTPIGKHREPDLSYVIKTAQAVAAEPYSAAN